MGAGRVVFTRQLVGDILGFPELADVRFVLHDIDAERLALAQGTALQPLSRMHCLCWSGARVQALLQGWVPLPCYPYGRDSKALVE